MSLWFSLPAGAGATAIIVRMGTCVLVIDDDPVFRGLAKRMLRNVGLAICGEASTAEAGMSSAMALQPDAALVDVGLPDGDGVELAHRIAALPWRPRVVLTSCDRDATDRGPRAKRNGLAFVPKDELPDAPLERLLATG